MLAMFSRGSRHRNRNCASGNNRSRNGSRSAFFGVFSRNRIPAAERTGWPRASTSCASIAAWIRAAMSSVHCAASRRLDSTPAAPGCSSGCPSKSRWPSPPTVQSWVLAASVSNSSVLPERGAARMISGRPRACPPTRRRRAGGLTGHTTRNTRPSITLKAATRLLRTTMPRDSSRAFSRRPSRSAAKRSQALESVPCRA